jgi:acetate kinase
LGFGEVCDRCDAFVELDVRAFHYGLVKDVQRYLEAVDVYCQRGEEFCHSRLQVLLDYDDIVFVGGFGEDLRHMNDYFDLSVE